MAAAATAAAAGGSSGGASAPTMVPVLSEPLAESPRTLLIDSLLAALVAASASPSVGPPPNEGPPLPLQLPSSFSSSPPSPLMAPSPRSDVEAKGSMNEARIRERDTSLCLSPAAPPPPQKALPSRAETFSADRQFFAWGVPAALLFTTTTPPFTEAEGFKKVKN